MKTRAPERGTRAALVTGASSGIGLELSRLLARRGHDVILLARREEVLSALADELRRAHGVACTVLAADLSRREAPREVDEELRARAMEVDILVNNSGFGWFGHFAEADLQRQLDMLQVNITALTELTGRLLSPMLARGSGRVLNVASTAAFQPGPLMAVYYASKAYVLSFSEAIAEELAGSGVTVTALCPGPTRTAFQDEAGLVRSGFLYGRMVADAAGVARYGYEAMMAGRRVAIPGLLNRTLAAAVRFAPRRLVTAEVRRMQERLGRSPS
jgi:short-subunit dehydrogenase